MTKDAASPLPRLGLAILFGADFDLFRSQLSVTGQQRILVSFRWSCLVFFVRLRASTVASGYRSL